MNAEQARLVLLAAFRATGEVPEAWLVLIDLVTAPPTPVPNHPEIDYDRSR